MNVSCMMEGISRYIHFAIVRLLNGQGMKTF
ncbi:hypothetical protein SME22J_19280 [Serratia marcescens]|nr:hypothetical protein SME22J_19280 [Serratia marcescens]